MSAEDRLRELGIELPPPFAPVGTFVAARMSRGMLYVSGQGPAGPDGMVTGKVGGALTLSQAVEAARLVGLDLLVDVFGEAGRHARSAVGVAELPFNIAVEVELVAEID